MVNHVLIPCISLESAALLCPALHSSCSRTIHCLPAMHCIFHNLQFTTFRFQANTILSPDVGRARVWLLECSGNYHSRNPLHQRCTNNTLNAAGKYKYIAICFSVSHRNTALRIAQPCFISINHSYCLMAKMTCCRILQQLAKIT